ncbi:hypothetical protein QYF36_025770 [Acer negundo]|nr:hypothetical protein QYF36_025770 [Acer negundo]
MFPEDEDLSSVVEGAWGNRGFSTNVYDLHSKLNWCAAKLSKWSRERFRSLRKLIDRTQRSIEDLYKNVDIAEVMNEIKSNEKELDGLIAKEEIY